MVDRWYPISIEQTHIDGGFTIVLTTDIPCHLWLFWTDKEPWVHPRTRRLRGLSVPWNAYWCYVAWTIIGQEEDGDTLTHTFQWTGWEHCQTKYFRFHGNINDVTSPSDSPIFQKHYTTFVPPPPLYLGYTLCESLGWFPISKDWYYGQMFEAVASGETHTLTVDIEKYGNPGDIIIRLYPADGVAHIPEYPHLWETQQSSARIPVSPDHAQIAFAVPPAAIVQGEWYCFGIKPQSNVAGNGFNLYNSQWCLNPPATLSVWWGSGWRFQESHDKYDFWFKLQD